MTAPTLAREFIAEELAPGEYLKSCHETWSKLTYKDKCKLSQIFGIDQVLRIEMRYQAYTS